MPERFTEGHSRTALLFAFAPPPPPPPPTKIKPRFQWLRERRTEVLIVLMNLHIMNRPVPEEYLEEFIMLTFEINELIQERQFS